MPSLKIGAEQWGNIEKPFGDARATRAWVGPAVSWAPSTKLWITSTAGFGLTDAADAFLVRFLIGVGL